MTPPIVKRYLIALDRYKFLPFASLVVGVGVAGVVGMQPPPPTTYQAAGTLTYSPPATYTATGAQIQEQAKQLSEDILLTDYVIKEAAARVNVNPKIIGKRARVKLPKAPSKSSKEPKEAGPQTFNVIYIDEEQKRAADTVQALMEGIVLQSRTINSLRLKAIIKSIEERLPKVKQDLQAAEQKQERYVRNEGPAILAAQDGTLLTGITNSQLQQRQIQMTLGGIDTQINSLQRRLGLNADEAYTSSALSADPLIANLRVQIQQNETQLKIISRDLRPEHPTTIELTRKQQVLDKLLQERAAEVMGGKGKVNPLPAKIRSDSSLDPSRQQLANTLVALQTQRETLLQQLVATRNSEKELRQEYAKIPNKQLEQARLQQQVALHRVLYDKMQASLTDAKSSEAETVSSFTISQRPEVTADEKPSQSILLTVAAGGLIGLLVGGGLIFLLASMDGTCHTLEEILALLRDRDVLVLGEVPFITVLKDAPPVLLDSDSPYLEFYERIRSNLRRASSEPIKVLLLTSTESQEGKTIAAYNLGVAAARAGKRTLLIEADLRSPTNAKSLKVAPDPDANLEPLRYYGYTSDCTRLVPDVENLYIVPSPGLVRHVAAILESSEFRRLLEDARNRFDLVILDAPSLSSCNDALMIQPYTDGLLLVTRPGYTQGSMLGEAVDRLTEAELPLLGAIVNGVDKVVSIPPAIADVEVREQLERHTENAEAEEKPAGRSKMKL